MRFGRFSLVGLLGAALQLILISALTKRVHLDPIVATPISVEIVILHNFLWHERFTWPDRRTRHFATRLWRFQAGNGLVSLVGNTFLMHCFVDLLKAPPTLSAAAAIALCSIANFLIADRWVYADFTPVP
jgi:putative flippase GtrA